MAIISSLTSDTALTTNIGVGSGISDSHFQGGNSTIDGNIAFGGNNTGCTSGNQNCDGTTVTGSITLNSAAASQSVLDAQSLASTYSAVTGLAFSGTEICLISSGCGVGKPYNPGNTSAGIGANNRVYNVGDDNPAGGLTIRRVEIEIPNSQSGYG